MLTNFYTLARAQYPDQQAALRAALSAYNTGSFTLGFANGYVAKYVGGATGGSVQLMRTPASTGDPVAAFVSLNPFTATTVVSFDNHHRSGSR